MTLWGKTRMQHFPVWSSAAVLFVMLTITVPAAAYEGAEGKVVVTSGGELGLELSGGHYGMGSKVEILYATPDGDEISYGFCCIDNIRDRKRAASGDEQLWTIIARPVEVQGQASVGLAARVIPLEGPEMVAWLEQAAAGNCRGAQMTLANHYQFGWDVAQDWDRAFELIRKAAQDDHLAARYELANMLDSRSLRLPFDDPARDAMAREAFQIVLALAEEGYIYVYRLVAEKYRFGLGTEANEAEAEKWDRLAAENPPFEGAS